MKKLLLVPVLTAALLALLAAPAFAGPKTFYVSPSGGNDTGNIQAAFDAAVNAGPGSTVQLSAGHFYTNNIFVTNFHGCFKGAGEHRTVVDCLRGLDPSLPGVTVLPDSGGTPNLFAFDGGHINVSDMSFDITPFSPVDADSNGGSDVLEIIVLVANNASSSFDHVGLAAGAGNDNGFNTDEGIVISGIGTDVWTTSGSDSIRDCSIVGPCNGVMVMGLTRGRATISGNVFDNADFSCLVSDSSASQVTICHNQMSAAGWDDVVLWQGLQAAFFGGPLPSLPAPRLLIADNHLLGTTYAGGVEVRDDSCLYETPDRLDATIADNTISLDNGGWDGGIDGFYAQGIKVVDNHISGVGDAAINVGTGPAFGMNPGPTVGWQIIGNNVSGVTPSDAIWGQPLAQIWLGSDAAHCLVVGGCTPTTVLDQGTDDTLINVTRLPLPATASASPMGQTKRMLMKGLLP